MVEATQEARSTEPKPQIAVVRIADQHAEAVAEFFRTVWDPAATAERVRAARLAAMAVNPVEPGVDVPAWSVMSNGKILGYIGTIPTLMWNGVSETPGHWMKGFMVLAEYRNGPIGYAVLREAVKHIDLSAVMTVALPARRLFTALGFVDLGVLWNYISLLRPAQILSNLELEALGLNGLPAWALKATKWLQRSGTARFVGGLAGIGMETRKGLGRWRARGFSVSCEANIKPRELDDLWQRVRRGLSAAPVRNGAYLRWRYPVAPTSPYDLLAVRSGDRLIGVVVVRQARANGDPRLRGINVATLADIVFPVDNLAAGRAALAGAEQLARKQGADALLCSASHPALTEALRHMGYFKLPGNMHFLIRDPGNKCSLPTTLADWWLTRGDASSDEVF